MWGRGPRGSNGTCSMPCWFSVTPSTTHNQIGPFWCCFPSGWVWVHSRPLWVPPTNSPVRPGVSPADASTPMGVFSQGFEALFPRSRALGCMVSFPPPLFLPIYLCENVEPQGLPATDLWGLLAAAWPAPFIPQSATLLGPPATALLRVLSAPAAHLCPSYWSG